MKLYNSLKSLILEIASVDSVTDSIKNRQVVSIYYTGDEPGGKGLRIIEPVCLGYSKAGNLVLRAWDTDGASHTAYLGKQPKPSWRLFRLDKIVMYKSTGDTFNEARPNYNLSGDKSMTNVLINAKFDNTPTQQIA
jgi:predicted DNA-binding transcriptional regulator YafY